MRIKCIVGFHEWNGCRCVHCGKTRDDGHDWNGCRCAHCGKTRDDGHKWVASSKNCVVCGKEAREITIDDKGLFFDAVKRGNVKKVSASLKDNPILIFGWSPSDTPLHVAVEEGKIEMTKFLLANGADVNAANNDGATPLHVAQKIIVVPCLCMWLVT